MTVLWRRNIKPFAPGCVACSVLVPEEHTARWHFLREEGTYGMGAASLPECLMVNVQVSGVPGWRRSRENDRITSPGGAGDQPPGMTPWRGVR